MCGVIFRYFNVYQYSTERLVFRVCFPYVQHSVWGFNLKFYARLSYLTNDLLFTLIGFFFHRAINRCEAMWLSVGIPKNFGMFMQWAEFFRSNFAISCFEIPANVMLTWQPLLFMAVFHQRQREQKKTAWNALLFAYFQSHFTNLCMKCANGDWLSHILFFSTYAAPIQVSNQS